MSSDEPRSSPRCRNPVGKESASVLESLVGDLLLSVKRVIYCVDRNRFAEKVYGVWVERPSDRDRELLKQRRLRQWLDRQRENPPSGHLCARNLEEDVQKDLNQFLVRARDRCSDKEFNGRVLEETLALMRGWGCFETLETEGDPLVKAKQ